MAISHTTGLFDAHGKPLDEKAREVMRRNAEQEGSSPRSRAVRTELEMMEARDRRLEKPASVSGKTPELNRTSDNKPGRPALDLSPEEKRERERALDAARKKEKRARMGAGTPGKRKGKATT